MFSSFTGEPEEPRHRLPSYKVGERPVKAKNCLTPNASLHLQYTNWKFHYLKENLQGKEDIYNDTKRFQRYHGPKGLSSRDSTVCSRP
uniref:Uncharacterized protein n=1 Tax=Callithrix jacchus TaxID=9483 RepID=A0A8I3W8N6_CALJA